ncbi:relaxase/mobilization nuclease domain-containing protein [Parapedomonas caeni]
MIIKGGSRAGPRQLAAHLQRTDTNERMEVLELHSGLDDLAATFRDWQTLSEGTRGKKGLYHVNIDPDARYDMTPQQWARAVEVLEQELGLDGQPRAVVLHEKKGRQHIHIVWARTDLETMTMRSDSNNYLAHERASLKLEREFGHEHVPGKHAKRDRAKQPEFPRADVSHAEHQQAERSGLSTQDRRAQFAALKSSCDSGMAFKVAVEDAGYVLARGDSKDFVLVGPEGSVYSLSRELKMKAAEVRAFMAVVDRDILPTASEAKAQQRERQKDAEPPAFEMQRPPVEDLAPAPEAQGEMPDAQEQDSGAPELAPAVAAALAAREQAEAEKLAKWHHAELRQLRHVLVLEARDKMDGLRRQQQAERERFIRDGKLSGIEGYIEALQNRLNPGRGAEKRFERDTAWKHLRERQAIERADLRTLIRQDRAEHIEELKERHDQQRRDQQAGFARDRVRYAEDSARAARLLAQVEEDRREAERQQQEGRAAEPPPRPAK